MKPLDAMDELYGLVDRLRNAVGAVSLVNEQLRDQVAALKIAECGFHATRCRWVVAAESWYCVPECRWEDAARLDWLLMDLRPDGIGDYDLWERVGNVPAEAEDAAYLKAARKAIDATRKQAEDG
jgi:hypothetical protein